MDLLDRPSIDAMVDTVVGEWGRIDVLINNAIYQGPGRMDRVLELDLDAATKLVVGNYVNQLHLIQLVVPGMLERGGGRVVNMASATATMDPPAPAGDGGWGLGYGASKAAFLRVAGQLHVEFAVAGPRRVQRRPRVHHQRQAERRAVQQAVPRRAAGGHRRGDRVAVLVRRRARARGHAGVLAEPVQADATPRRMAAMTTMTAYQTRRVGCAARVPRGRRADAGAR